MAAKKYKPALIELIGKGPLKPGKNGSISTPKWFHGSAGTAVTDSDYASVGKTRVAEGAESCPADRHAADAESRPAMLDGFDSHGPTTDPPRYAAIRLAPQALYLMASYWVVALAGLTMLFFFVLFYAWGHKAGADATAQQLLTNAPPSREMRTIAQSPARRDVIPHLPKQTTPIATEHLSTPAQPTGIEKSAMPTPTITGDGQVLIMCGHGDIAQLKPVQQYFLQAGIPTGIGRRAGRFVLFSQYSVKSAAEADARTFRNRVAQLGAGYNNSKPKDAIGFTASTFQGAYWARADSIDLIEQKF